MKELLTINDFNKTNLLRAYLKYILLDICSKETFTEYKVKFLEIDKKCLKRSLKNLFKCYPEFRPYLKASAEFAYNEIKMHLALKGITMGDARKSIRLKDFWDAIKQFQTKE